MTTCSSRPPVRRPGAYRRPAAVAALSAVATGSMLAMGGCARAVDGVIAGAISAPAADVAARGGADPMPGDPQTLMTRLRPARPGDAARADQIAATVRGSIARYRDVKDAVADGYRSFPPEPSPRDRIIHYVHQGRSRREARRIDPAQPGALLYERTAGGGLRLVGAMYTAPVTAPLAELDARVPLSVTQWHLHQNVCVPRPVWDGEQWARTVSGRPMFGPGSPIATEAACRQVGGRFLPTVFGWMAHVYVFAEDPKDLWNAMYGHEPHGQEGHGHSH